MAVRDQPPFVKRHPFARVSRAIQMQPLRIGRGIPCEFQRFQIGSSRPLRCGVLIFEEISHSGIYQFARARETPGAIHQAIECSGLHVPAPRLMPDQLFVARIEPFHFLPVAADSRGRQACLAISAVPNIRIELRHPSPQFPKFACRQRLDLTSEFFNAAHEYLHFRADLPPAETWILRKSQL